MPRRVEKAALAVLVATVGAMCVHLTTAPPRDPEHARIWDLLVGAGLEQHRDVEIEVSGREVARGFTRPDCDGLLLVAELPRTAQGWGHLAPRLGWEEYAVSYLYRGTVHGRVPVLERLGDRLVGELRGADPVPVVALAERGNCGLVGAAATALVARGYGDTGEYSTMFTGESGS